MTIQGLKAKITLKMTKGIANFNSAPANEIRLDSNVHICSGTKTPSEPCGISERHYTSSNATLKIEASICMLDFLGIFVGNFVYWCL